MKITKALVALIMVTVLLVSCKAIVKGAAKYWTNQQIAEFTANCEKNARTLISAEKAKVYCDCAVHKVAKAYPDYAAVKKASIREVLKVAKSCEDNVN